MMNKKSYLVLMATLLTIFSATSVFPKITFKPLKKEKVVEVKQTQDPRLVYRFFDEDYISGGYAYWYPDNSKVFIPEESGKNGEVALQFDLEANDYSGGSVCLYNLLYDMSDIFSTGALQFWIKGAVGGEIAWIALVDEENTDGKKAVVRLPLQNYGGIKSEWTQIQVPLVDFGNRGVFWDEKKKVEVPEKFNWKGVGEFRVEIKKADNPSFKVWVDDVFILRDVFEAKELKDEIYWDEVETEVAALDITKRPKVNDVFPMFDNGVVSGGFTYVYGGKTASSIINAGSKNQVLACYLDNRDYSGVTVALGAGKNADIRDLRKKDAAGLAFWGKGGKNVKAIYVGLLDDESDGAKVQTKVALSDFGDIDTTWKYFMIPLHQFQDNGKFWDESKKAEVLGQVDWSKINEVRFSNNKAENKVENDSVPFYVDYITFIDSIPNYVNPATYWANFKSDKPDIMIHTFENGEVALWEGSIGPKSEVRLEEVKSGAKNGGSSALSVSYKLNDWCDAVCDYKKNNIDATLRDWTQHWGIKFEMYTSKAYQGLVVQVNDAGGEVFVAATGSQRGWNEVLVPFKDFYKFPYWQPEDAVQNGKFDMEKLMSIDFKPSGEGTAGTYYIDNVRLTNEREVNLAPVPEKIDVTISGNFDQVVTEKINSGIFGINTALWDGDFLKPQTVAQVKPINHAVLRYPGGLRADEDHWQEVLDKKDWMVDTDEFLEFCQQTNTTPMITVNFGTGTPEEAAKWVEHCNIKKKANVKYWEIGNELYGNWHANHCSAEEYGKRAAEFIKQMKAVDPSIIVTVVWVLEGDWNRIVFEYTKDLADGVNVHHYPQHFGEENDAALLSAPQTLNEILPNVKRQAQEYGTPGKHYEVWLTEWNSVDFEPGPQTLSIVNGLFVADYLGMLSKHNIEQASYWDIHNDVTPQGGDYGYLSRTGAPDGDNVPRPSYWAFKMASESLRGKLVEANTGEDNVTSYLTENNGKKSLLIVNKMPRTRAEVSINIPGFTGNADLKQLDKNSGLAGYSTKSVQIKQGSKIEVPAFSIVVIEIK